MKQPLLRLLVLMCLAGAAPAAQPVSPTSPQRGTAIGRAWEATRHYLAEHVEIGSRWTHFSLHDDKRTPEDTNGNGEIDDDELLAVSFLGSIIELDPQNSDRLDRLFLQWSVNRYWGFELTYDEIRAKTYTFWDGHTDGTFELQGPILTVYGEVTMWNRITPRAGVGVAFFDGNFDHDPLWRHAAGLLQTMDTENSTGIVYLLGCEIALNAHWALDLYARHTDAHIDAHYTIAWEDGTVFDDRGVTRFPMTNRAFGLGLVYSF